MAGRTLLHPMTRAELAEILPKPRATAGTRCGPLITAGLPIDFAKSGMRGRGDGWIWFRTARGPAEDGADEAARPRQPSPQGLLERVSHEHQLVVRRTNRSAASAFKRWPMACGFSIAPVRTMASGTPSTRSYPSCGRRCGLAVAASGSGAPSAPGHAASFTEAVDFGAGAAIGLSYSSQAETRADRATRAMFKIVRRLDPEEDCNDLPWKPKGMHWRTYNRLVGAI